MHEYSIVQALLQRVEEEAAAYRQPRITRIRVRIGELSGVETELLCRAYETFRQRSLCRDAELVVDSEPASWRCGDCGREVMESDFRRCSVCKRPAHLAAGGEILLERIEMEVP